MSQRAPASPELDIQAAQPPTLVKAAGGVVLGAGALGLLILVQAVTGFTLASRAYPYVGALAAISLVAAVAGLRLMRARPRSAIVALGASGLHFVVATVWLSRSVTGGFVSCFAGVAPLVAFGGVVLSALAIKPAKAVSDARAKLAAQGLDLGV